MEFWQIMRAFGMEMKCNPIKIPTNLCWIGFHGAYLNIIGAVSSMQTRSNRNRSWDSLTADGVLAKNNSEALQSQL